MLQIQDIEDFFTMQNVITSNTTQRLLYFMCRKMWDWNYIVDSGTPIKIMKVLENPLKFEYVLANSVICVTLYV